MKQVDYDCRAEFIRPIIIGDKEVAMSYDALCRGRHSLHYQIYCITTVTRDRHPLFTDINAARFLVHELRRLHEYGDVTSLAWVIMPDHLHWLIQLNERWPLSRVKHDDIRRIARYIVANPLRAGLVQTIGDYPHWDCIWMTD